MAGASGIEGGLYLSLVDLLPPFLKSVNLIRTQSSDSLIFRVVLLTNNWINEDKHGKRGKRDLLERREPCFTNIHFLPGYPLVAFKGSRFLLLTLQLLVILPVNCSLVTLPINSVVEQCCVGWREDESRRSLCVARLRCSCPGKGLTLGRVSWLILQPSHHGGQSVH